MRETKVRIKKLNENAIIPTRGSKQAAGYDLYISCLTSENILALILRLIFLHIALKKYQLD